MRLYAIGLDHESCPLEVLERVTAAASESSARSAEGSWDGPSRPAGWALLSTCNRFEIYAHFDGESSELTCRNAYKVLIGFVAARSGMSEAAFAPFVRRYGGRRSVDHLARVAAGLESAILGEPEILGQVAASKEEAGRNGHTTDVVQAAFRSALRAGRRARGETGVGRGSASFSTVIADIVADTTANESRRRVVVVGRGEIGGKVVKVLRKRGIDVDIVTRIAGPEGPADVYGLNELPALIQRADAVVLATSASTHILSRSTLEAAMAARPARPLHIVDAGMPRNVDPAVTNLHGVRLYDLNAVRIRMEDVVSDRRRAVPEVEAIIAREVEAFQKWNRDRLSADLITALRRNAEDIRRREVARALDRLPDLTPEAREALEHVSSTIVKKLLHNPTLNLRRSGEWHRKETSRLIRDLFELPIDDQQLI